MDIEDKDIELLELNYRNLHESVWDNHKVAWTVTSIFIPVLFGVQGYLVNQYYSFSKLQVIMGALVTESLLIIWSLIMRIFEHYNKVRFDRLKQIEDIFDNILDRKIGDLFEDKRGFSLYHLDYKEKPREFKLSPMRIYQMILWLYTLLNMILLCAKFLLP